MCSMPEFAYTVTEHDPARPWVVLGQQRDRVMLAEGDDFFTWANERWPAPRWSVELDPHELTRALWSR